MQARRFKTLKSVTDLVYGRFGLRRNFWKLAGHHRYEKRLIEIHKFEMQMYGIANGLEEWSRGHRKAHGRPAKPDDYLIEHAADIRAALTALSTAVDELAAFALSDEQRALIDDYELDLHAAWALDLTEDEAHEIARRQPRPKVEEPPKPVSERTSRLGRFVEVLGALVDAMPAPQPAPVVVRSWVPDYMTTTPAQRLCGGWS